MGEPVYEMTLAPLQLDREQVRREVIKMLKWLEVTEPKVEEAPIDDE